MRHFPRREDLLEAAIAEASRHGDVTERNGRAFLVVKLDCECGSHSLTEVDLTAIATAIWEKLS